MRPRPKCILLLAVVGLAVAFDQATKRIATEHLEFAPPRSYLGDTFRLQYALNPGSFLGLGGGLPEEARAWLMLFGVGALLLGVLLFTLLNARLRPVTVVALALILGGGLGNWLDRVQHGNVVVDFMVLGVGPLHTGVFNVADLFIDAGLALLVITQLVAIRSTEPSERES